MTQDLKIWLPKLSWNSIVVIVASEDPDWLHGVDTEERGCFMWARGAGTLGFAIRTSFADEIDILGEGVLNVSGVVAPMQWLAARVSLIAPTAGLSLLSVGAVLIGEGKHSWTQAQWLQMAEGLIGCSVRLVMMIADPPNSIRGAGKRLTACIRFKGCKSVHHFGEKSDSSVQFLVLGKISGFDGDLMLPSAFAERPMTRLQWKAEVLKTPMHLQDTFDMLLPPIKSKDVLGCIFAGAWLRGAEKRSDDAKVVRESNREARMERLWSSGVRAKQAAPSSSRGGVGPSSAVAETSRRRRPVLQPRRRDDDADSSIEGVSPAADVHVSDDDL